VAKKRATSKSKPSGRGSPEAIAKRRAARNLNTLFGDNGRGGPALDGRTEKRRTRLLKELREGRSGRPLKAIEVLTYTTELLELGETLGSIKKSGAKPMRLDLVSEASGVIQQTQREYAFRPEAWKMLGVDLDGSSSAGAKRGRKKSA
jgi:hypothetical protein